MGSGKSVFLVKFIHLLLRYVPIVVHIYPLYKCLYYLAQVLLLFLAAIVAVFPEQLLQQLPHFSPSEVSFTVPLVVLEDLHEVIHFYVFAGALGTLVLFEHGAGCNPAFDLELLFFSGCA